MKYAYSLLRGKDLETGEFSPGQREKQFAILQEAQKATLNLQNWHDFLGILKQSGFTGAGMLSSKMALFYAYIFYLIGKEKLGVKPFTLANVIGRWFFMTTLTSRDTGGSPETIMERDLAALRDIDNAADFIA